MDDPTGGYKLAWTGGLRWADVVSIEDFKGGALSERLEKAQAALKVRGGGVVYFPAGTYEFSGDVVLATGVILRGETPAGQRNARGADYDSPTRFVFPRYVPKAEGEGTPVSGAFKGIVLEDPAGAAGCGVVNIAIDHGHIALAEGAGHAAGRDRLVYGCVVRNAAVARRDVPDLSIGQKPWQRYTESFGAAVSVYSGENLLVANNRLPESGQDNFVQKDYVLLDRGKKPTTVGEVVFDYDNRPGIRANAYGIGGPGNEPPDGTPELYPWGFRKGIVVRDNYVFCTGRCAISFTGDGVYCGHNVVRFKPDVIRPTNTGRNITSGSSTNDNRAVEMRGWRWTVEGNDYEVYRNRCADGKFYINDGEGLMHEDT